MENAGLLFVEALAVDQFLREISSLRIHRGSDAVVQARVFAYGTEVTTDTIVHGHVVRTVVADRLEQGCAGQPAWDVSQRALVQRRFEFRRIPAAVDRVVDLFLETLAESLTHIEECAGVPAVVDLLIRIPLVLAQRSVLRTLQRCERRLQHTLVTAIEHALDAWSRLTLRREGHVGTGGLAPALVRLREAAVAGAAEAGTWRRLLMLVANKVRSLI